MLFRSSIGETRTVGRAVPGMKTAWYRALQTANGEQEMERYYSFYEARPNYTEIGIEGNDNIYDENSEGEKGSTIEEQPSWSQRYGRYRGERGRNSN